MIEDDNKCNSNVLSKKEYFAGLAMQSLIMHGDQQSTNASICVTAVDIAEFLIEELEKRDD